MAKLSTKSKINVGTEKPDRPYHPEFELSNALPIYVQLVTMFRGFIENDEWVVGQKLPALEDLAEEFGVARATVRQAIGFLEQEGLIERHRGRGTHVINKPKRDMWYRIPEDWESLIHVSEDNKAEWIADRVADLPPRASHDGITLAPQYHYSSRVHRRDGVPYLVGSGYIDARLYEQISKKDLKRLGTYRILNNMKGVKIERVDQTVVIGMADVKIAHHLEIPLNSPTAIVRRTIIDRNNILICETEGIYRGDFVRIESRLI